MTRFYLFLIFFSIKCALLISQPTYDMANAMVNDCEGILQDSNDGPDDSQYDHNEDYTFIICVPEADEIILNFEFFATEPTYDVLTIYQGNGKTGPIIAQLNGVIRPAPSFVVQGDCVTFHFVSDDNILANGWRMTWEVIIDEPKVPEMEVTSSLDCPMNGLEVQLNCPVDCDLLSANQFSVFGPGAPSVSRIEVLDCDPTSNTATSFKVFFNDSLRLSGTYRLNFEGEVQDACGEWHDIGSTLTFDLVGCPISVLITELEKACAGMCGRLRAEIIGGGGGNYRFSWSHTPSTLQEVEICPSDSTLVMVTVVDQNSQQSFNASYLYVPIPNPKLLNKLGPDTMCSNRNNHVYQVDIPGGRTYSRIIPEWEQQQRRYQFWRWNNSQNLIERDIVEYVDSNGCVDRDTFWIRPINAGLDDASCVGSNPFQVSGGTPTVGYWTGPGIDSSGEFNPDTEGTFEVTFHSPNGCQRTKRVRVTSEIEIPETDTICGGGNVDLRDLVTPFGGRWSGPQISNAYIGRVRADRLSPNNTYRYYYSLNGCRDSIDIFIEEISAGSNRTMCSSSDTMFLGSRGSWSGPGVYDSVRNAFYIGDLDLGVHVYTLNKNGCTDRFRLTIVEVEIEIQKSLDFCPEDQWISIEDRIDFRPGNGMLSAPFLKDTLGALHFNPSQLGPGSFGIYFDALMCRDSVTITVEGPAEIDEYTFCELDDAQTLEATPPGGTWSGAGILDPVNGLFDPRIVGRGAHEVLYTSPLGCVTKDTIQVIEFMEADVQGIDNIYCFIDTTIQFQISPPGGVLEIDKVAQSPEFNPTQLGPGTHEILYTSGSGDCESTKRIFFTVLFPIDGTAMASKDSICLGENVVINIDPKGGRGNLETNWNRNLGFGNSHIIFPDSSYYYQVSVSDGCSEELIDSILIYVYPEFEVEVLAGPEVCFNEKTFAEVIPPSNGNYLIEWDVNPVFTGQRLTGAPGNYDVKITNEKSGCSLEVDVDLPGAAPIIANFNTIPNGGCIDIIDNELRIIDLATGYSEGTIHFGDTSNLKNLLTDELVHYYNEAGEFTITQIVENELGCTDTLQKTICVESKTRVFVPNIFSPNDDGKNDELELFVLGVDRVEWKIYDRFGEMVFASDEKETKWDGTMDGRRLHNGVYVLQMTYYPTDSSLPFKKTQSVTLLR